MSLTFLLKVDTIVGLWFSRVNLEQKQILHITTLLAHTQKPSATCFSHFQLAVVPLTLYAHLHPSSTRLGPLLPMLEIILPAFLIPYMHWPQRPNCSPNWVSFSDPVMDTYCLPTEVAQEHAGLPLSVLILLLKHLMEDLLNHGVSGSTVQSQALSCSPAIYAVTCHRGVKKGVLHGDPISPQTEQLSCWYPRLVPAG